MTEKNNGLLFNNQFYIPIEILSLILSNVDVQTLYKHCTLVCKLWNTIIKECVCKIKCEQEIMNDKSNKHKLQWFKEKQQRSYHVYQIISISNKSFYKNLIRNPCGMDGLNYWILDKNFIGQSSNFTIEDFTLFDEKNCKVNDELISCNITKCFTLKSLDLGARLQIIDLYKCGLTQKFIDVYQPPIYVSEWYGCRPDSVMCNYNLNVILLDANNDEIDRCNCYYSFHDQGIYGTFQKVQHIFRNYGKNVRYVYFYSWGQGSASYEEEFWNRHQSIDTFSGPKFTNSNVQLFYPNDTHLNNEIDEYSQESYHKNCLNHCKFLSNKSIPNYWENQNIYKKNEHRAKRIKMDNIKVFNKVRT